MGKQPQEPIFPILLDILSNKPLLSENEDTLLEDVKQKLGSNGKALPTNFKRDWDTVLSVGKNLGILSHQNGEIGLPFILKCINATNSKYVARLGRSADDPHSSYDEISRRRMSGIPIPRWMENERESRTLNADRSIMRCDRSRSRPGLRNISPFLKKKRKSLKKKRNA